MRLADHLVALAFVGGADWTAETSATGDFVDAPKLFNEPTFAYYAVDQSSALGNGSWAGFSWAPEVQILSSVVVGYIDTSDTVDVNGDRPVYLTDQFEALQITPLPAALPLMGGVLGAGGMVALRRKRKAAAKRAAA
jgi:hypothetical protein